MRRGWSTVCFADHLIHEAVHQRVHADYECNPALLNPEHRGAPSPIRIDSRPLIGTFHATLVFMRLTQFMERVHHRHRSHENECRLHRHYYGFQVGVRVLQEHAKFTPNGERLFAEVQAELQRMQAELPEPDARLYNKMEPDYVRPSSITLALVE